MAGAAAVNVVDKPGAYMIFGIIKYPTYGGTRD